MKKMPDMKKTSIGGQALIEGVMMRGPKKTAMAVRHTSGNIVTEEWAIDTDRKPKFWKLPFFRGIYNLIDSLRFGYKCLMRSAVLAGLEEDEQDEPQTAGQKAVMTGMMIVSMVIGVALALGLFMYLPSFLYNCIANGLDRVHGGDFWISNAVLRGIFEGLLRLILFLAYISVISLMKDIRRVFMYHGAEHKTIFCYERGEELTIENVKKQSRFHPRCGTSFLILTLLIGIIVSICIQIQTVWLRVLIKIALLPLTVSIGYELIKLAGRKDNAFTRIISAPGLWIQRLTTKEPEDGMIECAITAFIAVIPEDEQTDKW